MTIRLRIPKTQVRIVGVAAVVVAVGAGAGVAAPGPRGTSVPSTGVVAVVPHDATPTFEQHPEAALAAAGPSVELPQAPQGPDPQQGEQQGQGQQSQDEPSQEQQAEATQGQAPPTEQTGDLMLTAAEREAMALVEQIIREEEGVLMGTGFDYNSGGRRDPFRSLIPSSSLLAPTSRPFGLTGFLISEVDLKAIAMAQGRYHAMVIGPNRRAYFLQVGTQLYDGHVVEIQPNEVLFEQQVPDVTGITGARRTRQVSKRLRTTNSGGG